MLVLSRRRNEKILIGTGRNQIAITVVDVMSNGKVRIGVDAPRHVSVHRQEVLEEIQRQKGKPA